MSQIGPWVSQLVHRQVDELRRHAHKEAKPLGLQRLSDTVTMVVRVLA